MKRTLMPWKQPRALVLGALALLCITVLVRTVWENRPATWLLTPAGAAWRTREAATSSPLALVFIGDVGTGDSHQKHIADRIEKLDRQTTLSAVMLLGDNIYDTGPFEHGLASRIIVPYHKLINLGIPFFAALGNHDYSRPRVRDGELNHPLFHMGGHPYYQKTFSQQGATVTVFVLCSETLKSDSAQVQWLGQALDACRSQWKILLLHRPLAASKVAHGPDKKRYQLLKPIIERPGGIDLVFAGHNHVYERRKPQNGVLHITLGNGGDLDRGIRFPPDPERAAGYNEQSCLGLLICDRRGVTFQVINERGRTIDRIRLSKQGAGGKLALVELAGKSGT